MMIEFYKNKLESIVLEYIKDKFNEKVYVDIQYYTADRTKFGVGIKDDMRILLIHSHNVTFEEVIYIYTCLDTYKDIFPEKYKILNRDQKINEILNG